VVELGQAIAPPLWEALAARFFKRVAFARGSSEPTFGNLFEPLHGE